MCSVLLAFQHFEAEPLRLAANRDEQLDRPAETFRLRATSPPSFTPLDERAGGTWIGVNSHGLVVAITNRFGAAPSTDRRSRGELVAMALEHQTTRSAADRISRLDPLDYNGFHLTIATADAAEIVWSDSSSFTRVELEPGIHVVTERSFGAAETPREDWIHQQLDGVEPEEFDRLMLHRSDDGFNGTIVEVPELNYGTRSSTLISLGDRPRLLHADGPPDKNEYADRSDELVDLLNA